MAYTHAKRRVGGGGARGSYSQAPGFTLVELMTVIFIIGLLVGILIPSLTAVRNAAKKTSSKATIGALSTGLEAFKNDHSKDFRQTNGYPPSFAHPPIGTFGFDPYEGEFPFLEASENDPPVVYGAHWLPAMLMGVDVLGIVPRGAVPPLVRTRPWLWYTSDPLGNGSGPLERSPLYLDPTGLKTVATEELPFSGPGPSGHLAGFFPNWTAMAHLPVIVDAFDQPILYYVSNTYGTTANLLEEERANGYQPSPPYYFHQDNEGFTGNDENVGWDFGSGGDHAIARSGEDLDATNIDDDSNTFAHFIHDGKAHRATPDWTPQSPLKPFNSDTFLLISAGRDGRYGTVDDVANFPLFSD